MLALVSGLAAGASIASAQAPVETLARRGWDALDNGRPADAAAAFELALKGAPGEPTLLLGAATAALLAGREGAARPLLQDALRADPALAPASVLLGELLYRTGDLQAAITTYQDALTHAPEHPQITRRLERWQKELELHGRFTQEVGVHFTVLFEGPAEAELAARAVDILEAAYWRLGAALFAYPPDVITVVLYTREQFRDITQSPSWAGGAFDGRIRVPVRGALQDVREFERVLRHEFTHALVRSIAPRHVPYWLNEGLAVYFEGGDLAGARAAVAGADGKLLPLSRLEAPFADLDAARARLAYSQSAVAVERLIDRAGAPAVVDLLTDLGAGVPLDKALERHMFISYDELQESLRDATP